jgi:hypothetical protein
MGQREKYKESETERLSLMKKLVGEQGGDWEGQYKPGSFGCHELLDRTSLAAEGIEREILTHPSCIQNAEWFALANDALSALHDLYQRIGAEHMKEDAEPSVETAEYTPVKTGRNVKTRRS